MIWFLLYIAGVIGFCVWDAVFGFSVVDFNGINNPPPIIPALVWFLAVPVIMLAMFVSLLSGIKDKRIIREKERKQLRIKAEREQQAAMAYVDQELDDFDSKLKRSR